MQDAVTPERLRDQLCVGRFHALTRVEVRRFPQSPHGSPWLPGTVFNTVAPGNRSDGYVEADALLPQGTPFPKTNPGVR